MSIDSPENEPNGILSQSISTLQAYLDENICTITDENFDKLSSVINEFEQDPSLLIFSSNGENRLYHYVECLTLDLELADSKGILLRSKVFYNMSKLVTWKRIVTYLPTTIYQLPHLLALLPEVATRGEESWYISYMILSWIYTVVLSPFKLEKSCNEIYHITAQYETFQSLKPIVSRIHSQLLIKNSELFNSMKDELDPLTMNYLLKSASAKHLFDPELVVKICKKYLEDSSSGTLMNLKLLPKLFKMSALSENWALMEDIISWFLSNMNNNFTRFRFKLAHSFAEIIRCLISELHEEGAAKEIIDARVEDSVKLLSSPSSWDLLDSDFLHTNLLVIAELSGVITKHWPEMSKRISDHIIPQASKFQQLRLNSIKGSQIKDASNFICWSVARSNRNGEVLDRKVMTNIYLNLLMCSIFDRDLMVRRSANAALQEVLGRYISPMKILDNRTVLRIIELPIINLAASYSENVLNVYEILLRTNSSEYFLSYFADWVVDYNLLANHDLLVVRLTIEALFQLLSKYSRSADGRVTAKLRSSINCAIEFRKPLTSIKLLSLLIMLCDKDIDVSLASHSNMDKLYEIYVSTLKFSHNQIKTNLFGFSVMLKYWILTIEKFGTFTMNEKKSELFFRIMRVIPDEDNQMAIFVPLVKQFVLRISADGQVWRSSGDKTKFWSKFESYVRINNTLICSALPELTPTRFLKIFYAVLPSLDCARKSQVIDSLADRLPVVVTYDHSVLTTIAGLLNDYTITQQGDVGRYVRISSAKLVAQNIELFSGRQNEHLRKVIILSLMRLSAEQVKDLKVICFDILCRLFDYDIEINKKKINSQLLEFQHLIFKGHCTEFWQGYLLSGGAIHFSDAEVTSLIDDFLKHYYFVLEEQDRLDLCNCLIRVIPSAKDIIEFQQDENRNGKTISTRQDILKTAISHLTFWLRIMESGIEIDSRFNFEGVYAKLYNLHLLDNHLLRISVIKLFPHLITSSCPSAPTENSGLTDSIIKRLLMLLQRECLSSGEKSPVLRNTIFEALAQIYLHFNAESHLAKIRTASTTKQGVMQLSESEMLI